jgi:hypothetical protein
MMIRAVILLLFLSAMPVSNADEPNYSSFDGRWCGKWDKLYDLCIDLKDIKTNPIAKYQWREQTNGKFQKSTKRITIVNQHTIKLENIFVTLDKNDLTKAKAIGLFTQQTRYAELVKSVD